MRKLLTILVAGLMMLSVAAAIATAEKESTDKWKPAGTQFKAANTNGTFTINEGGLQVKEKCQLFQIKGKTPGTQGGEFADQTKINVGTPIFEGTCEPGKATPSGEWKLELHSGALQKRQEEECKVASQGAYNAATEDDDCISIIIPKSGAVVKTAGVCEITVAPTQQFELTGYYDDDGQQGLAKFSTKGIPIEKKVEALCPGGAGAGVAEFNGSFGVNPLITD